MCKSSSEFEKSFQCEQRLEENARDVFMNVKYLHVKGGLREDAEKMSQDD